MEHLAGRTELLNAGGGVHKEGEEAEHDVDDDSVDVGAEEGGLKPTSHGVQDDADGDQEGSLHKHTLTLNLCVSALISSCSEKLTDNLPCHSRT